METDACLHMSNINTQDLIPTSNLFKKVSWFQIVTSSLIVWF